MRRRAAAELEQIKSGDQRVAAAALSLGQELAGNACVAFSMIGDLERVVRAQVRDRIRLFTLSKEECQRYFGSESCPPAT
ncbi:MAG TPA: hypothetical protein VIH91_02790 [Terriglobales bacterium]